MIGESIMSRDITLSKQSRSTRKIIVGKAGLPCVIALTIVFTLFISGCDQSIPTPQEDEPVQTPPISDVDTEEQPDIVNEPEEEAEHISLELNDRGITNEILAEMVESGEIPQNVTELFLHYNQISDITPLQSLSKLDKLWMYSNQISDITSLQSLNSLHFLSLNYNEISDISPLRSMTDLRELSLWENQIDDITALQSMQYLNTLHLNYNNIVDISPLQELLNLLRLGLVGNQINDITYLESLTILTLLDLRDNEISDIEPLRSLTNLTYLDLSFNHISDLEPLMSLVRLEELFIGQNSIDGGYNYVEWTDEQISKLKEALPNCDIDY